MRAQNEDRWWTRLFDRLNTLAYQELFLIWVTAVTFFGLVFFVLSYMPGEGPVPLSGDTAERFLNALYYSIITATNTGYGDILPHGLSRFFAALEAVAGLFIFAVFITKLMSRRQDIALHEIHKLTFENTFHNIREALHTMRKDFDLVIERVKAKQGVREDDYRILAVAYEQNANLLNELPTFYHAGGGFYTLDRRREDLLREAVGRTLQRTHRLLETLSEHGVPWTEHEESVSRLRELVRTSRSCITEWQKRSPYKESDGFELILLTVDRIAAQLDGRLAEEEKSTKKQKN